MFYTYIVHSKRIKRYYTCQTIDLDRRLDEHNRGKTPFLARGIPWELVYSNEFESRKEAMHHEKVIKKRGAERFLTDLNSQCG